MKKNSLISALGLVALLATSPAVAQTAAPAPAARSASAEPTASQLSLGKDVLIASGVSRSFGMAVPQFLDQIGSRVTQTRPDLIKDLNVVMEQVKPEFDKRVDTMIDQGARAYATRFSEDELKQISGFFKSATGAKYIESQPLILNDMFIAFQAWQQQLSTDMMARVREEMKKKGHEL